MFNKLKNSLGFSNKKKTSNSSNSNSNSSTNTNSKSTDKNYVIYDVTFKTTKLGFNVDINRNESDIMTLNTIDTNNTNILIYVTDCIENSEAYKNGVRDGDFVVSLDGNVVLTVSAFNSFIDAMGRPLTIR